MANEMTKLSDVEITAVVALVTALVERDEQALAKYGAYAGGGDPYMYVDDYDASGGVDLVLPPGEPATWSAYVLRSSDNPGWAAVEVQMWCRRRGETDLTLQLDVSTEPDGEVKATFHDLHVM